MKEKNVRKCYNKDNSNDQIGVKSLKEESVRENNIKQMKRIICQRNLLFDNNNDKCGKGTKRITHVSLQKTYDKSNTMVDAVAGNLVNEFRDSCSMDYPNKEKSQIKIPKPKTLRRKSNVISAGTVHKK